MANALATETMPPAPDIPQMPEGGGGPAPSGPPTNALAAQPQQQQQQQPPAPTHQQTVAALRHFDAVRSTFEKIAKNPDLGKSDVKKSVIDGAMKLVADRIVTPAQAVMMLGVFPENPFKQKQWIAEQIMHNQQAETVVLEHHRAAFAGMPTPDDQKNPSIDTHHDDLMGLMGHYKRG